MRLVFCSDPLDPRRPEPDFARETTAAERLGIGIDLVDHDALVRDDPEQALRGVGRRQNADVAVYRGWMVTPEQYARLHDALAARGLRLVNDPVAFRHCHHLAECYPVIREHGYAIIGVRSAESEDAVVQREETDRIVFDERRRLHATGLGWAALEARWRRSGSKFVEEPSMLVTATKRDASGGAEAELRMHIALGLGGSLTWALVRRPGGRAELILPGASPIEIDSFSLDEVLDSPLRRLLERHRQTSARGAAGVFEEFWEGDGPSYYVIPSPRSASSKPVRS